MAPRCINSALRGEAKAIWECRASWNSHALSSPTAGAAHLPPAALAPSMDAQQERHRCQDYLGPVALITSAAGAPLYAFCVWEEAQLTRLPVLLRSPSCHHFPLPGLGTIHLADPCPLPSPKHGLHQEKPKPCLSCSCSCFSSPFPTSQSTPRGGPL